MAIFVKIDYSIEYEKKYTMNRLRRIDLPIALRFEYGDKAVIIGEKGNDKSISAKRLLIFVMGNRVKTV